jgi:hypothetical protein
MEETDSLTLDLTGEYIYDTMAGTLTPPGGGTPISHNKSFLGTGPRTPLVINTGRFAIASGSSLRAIGPRPILIVSWSDMVIAGDIDASSIDTNDTGAGANGGPCSPAMEGTSQQEGGGGGGGGGFGAAGGTGGVGRIGQNPGDTPGGAGGIAKAAAFHGGCPGARGGFGDSLIETERGRLGEGGGAVYLVAQTSMTVSAVINAGGMGGGGASNNRAAGGGGGSGGVVGLEAATVTLQAGCRLAANGGGGGGGGNNGDSEDGIDGLNDDNAAPGGAGESANGGPGGALNVPAGQLGLSNDRGGGGGGGGVGFIVIVADSISANDAETISPAYQTSPISVPN